MIKSEALKRAIMTKREMRSLFFKGCWNWRSDSHYVGSDRELLNSKRTALGVDSLYNTRRSRRFAL